ALRTPAIDVAKTQAETWLRTTGKVDQKAFDAIWASEELTILDKVADTIKLGNADAAKILTAAANADKNAPSEVPAIIKDNKQNPYFRANLALAFARNLSGARVYEEALEALDAVTPEQVVDPSAYFFYKAVAEHALMKKDKAQKTILRLLDDVTDSPDRYKMLATIMFVDMQAWKKDEKDLGNIVKLMDNSERRLDLNRPGKVTQEIQKKIVFRLDELIKEKEAQAKGGGQANGGNCPGGGKPMPGNGGGNNPSSPMQDSNIAPGGGPGQINAEQLKKYQENWGKMPEQERARVIQEMTRDLPPRSRVIIEDYFKSLNKNTQTP
ncbi:MAG: hypothetical protein K8T89_19740, partial [Planctomycetes bacterium]|nr:hypothetical protein [Planctomycetota bacterium]